MVELASTIANPIFNSVISSHIINSPSSIVCLYSHRLLFSILADQSRALPSISATGMVSSQILQTLSHCHESDNQFFVKTQANQKNMKWHVHCIT